MTKTPRIAGNTLIKYLINKKMFSKQSVKGSHVTLKHDNVLVTVPAGNTN